MLDLLNYVNTVGGVLLHGYIVVYANALHEYSNPRPNLVEP